MSVKQKSHDQKANKMSEIDEQVLKLFDIKKVMAFNFICVLLVYWNKYQIILTRYVLYYIMR